MIVSIYQHRGHNTFLGIVEHIVVGTIVDIQIALALVEVPSSSVLADNIAVVDRLVCIVVGRLEHTLVVEVPSSLEEADNIAVVDKLVYIVVGRLEHTLVVEVPSSLEEADNMV